MLYLRIKRYWMMTVFFFFAESLGLDIRRSKNDIQQMSLIEKVERDFESGIRSGVNRTPSFFINGEKYDGSWEENEFLQYLKGQLAQIAIS